MMVMPRFVSRLSLALAVAVPWASSGSGCFSDEPEPPGFGGDVIDRGPALNDSPVVRALTAPRSISGGSMVATRGGRLVVGDADRDRLYVVDLARENLVRTFPLDPGSEPGRAVEDDEGLVHVVLRRAGAVITLDAVEGELIDETSVCPAPRGIAHDAELNRLLVACVGGEVVSFDAETRRELATVKLPFDDLRDIGVTTHPRSGARQVWVTRFRDAEIAFLNENFQPVRVAAVSLDQAPAMRPTVAWRARSTPEGEVVVLHQGSFAGTVPVSEPSGYGSGGLNTGPCFGSIVQTVVTTVTGQGRVAQAFVQDMTLAVDFALSTASSELALVSAGTAPRAGRGFGRNAAVLDTRDPQPCSFGQSFGVPPQTAEGQIVAVEATPDGFAFFSREPARVYLPSGRTVDLGAGSMEDTGHDLFHLDDGGGIACASCHPEGGEDAHVWTFEGFGDRRTQSLRGQLSGTEPFHWDGDLSDFRALGDEVFTHRMGGGDLSEAQTEALAEFVDSIPHLPARTGLDPADVAKGRDLFVGKAACGTCHVAGTGTLPDSQVVGTGGAFQVPSLAGVSYRAPYLHTGCAGSLDMRIESASCGGGDRHGAVEALSADEVRALVTYMNSL